MSEELKTIDEETKTVYAEVETKQEDEKETHPVSLQEFFKKVLNVYLIKTCIYIARSRKCYKKNLKNKKTANWN